MEFLVSTRAETYLKKAQDSSAYTLAPPHILTKRHLFREQNSRQIDTCQYHADNKADNLLATAYFYSYLTTYLSIKKGTGTTPFQRYLQVSAAADESK